MLIELLERNPVVLTVHRHEQRQINCMQMILILPYL